MSKFMNFLLQDWNISTSYFKMILGFEMCYVTTVSNLIFLNWYTLTYLKGGFPSKHNFTQNTERSASVSVNKAMFSI